MDDISLKDVKISFNGKELTEFDGKLKISKPDPSMIEDHVKCLYCQGVTARGGSYSDDYKYATFFDREENKFCFGRADPDGISALGKFKINYCPFCGRKLE